MAQETKSFGDLEQIKGAPAPAAAPEYVQKLDSLGRAYATGKRKNAVARVWLNQPEARNAFETFLARKR